MNKPPEYFCPLPWVGLEATTLGTVRPCCSAEEEIADENGRKMNLKRDDFSSIRNGPFMRNLRQEFLDGKKPALCTKCWDEEAAGKTSKRMYGLIRLAPFLKEEGKKSWTLEPRPLLSLDLKLGTVCNLKCRICGSWSSGQWAKEELQSLAPGEEKGENRHFRNLQAGRWPRESHLFWEELEKNAEGLRILEFTGGEPFLIAEHFKLLRTLIDQGHASHIEIHYNTNGTQFPEQHLELWRSFKQVEIAFSIDDLEGRFEYQREGAQWSQVLANLEKFRDLRARQNNIRLQLCCTVSVFNVYYLDQMAKWIADQNFDFVYWNMLHQVEHFSISRLPLHAKEAIIRNLRECSLPSQFRQDFAMMIKFMENGISQDGREMREAIQVIDSRRHQLLRDHHPELAHLIQDTPPGGP